MINQGIHVKWYDSNDIVPYYLLTILQKDPSSLSHLHVSTEKHDNIIDKNNQIEVAKFDISVIIGTNYCPYDYNDEFWDSI